MVLNYVLAFLALAMCATGIGALLASTNNENTLDASAGVLLLAGGALWVLTLYGVTPA